MREKNFFYRRSKLSGAGLPVRPCADTTLENPVKWVPKVHGALPLISQAKGQSFKRINNIAVYFCMLISPPDLGFVRRF